MSFRYAPALPEAVIDVSFEIILGETARWWATPVPANRPALTYYCAYRTSVTASWRSTGMTRRDFPQEALRRLLTLVPQDVYLFNSPLRENIRLGPGRTPPAPRSPPRRGRRWPTSSSSGCPTATTPSRVHRDHLRATQGRAELVAHDGAYTRLLAAQVESRTGTMDPLS